MIFKVYMKDPDVLEDDIKSAIDADLKESDLNEGEKEAVRELRYEEAADVASKWFEYGEYLTVEIDTEKQTIRVIPVVEE